MNYTIYRGSWRRGGDSIAPELGDTSLYNPRNNMMCCLGQCALEAGVPLVELSGIGEPCDVNAESILVASGLLYADDDYGRQSQFSNEAISINDDETISDDRREEMLINLAKKHGNSITFVDGIAPWFAEVPA